MSEKSLDIESNVYICQVSANKSFHCQQVWKLIRGNFRAEKSKAQY